MSGKKEEEDGKAKRLVIGNAPGSKFELALGRNGNSMEDVEWLSTRENSKALFLLRTGRAQLVMVPLLERTSDIWLGVKTGESFIARSKFVINTRDRSLPKILHLDADFTTHFLGKVEDAPSGYLAHDHFVYGYSVNYETTLDDVSKELGGEDKMEMTLSEIYDLVKESSWEGSSNPLKMKYCYCFLVNDSCGIRRWVFVKRLSTGWVISSGSSGDAVVRPGDDYHICSHAGPRGM